MRSPIPETPGCSPSCSSDSHNHRPIAGDSDLADASRCWPERTRTLIWTRQRQINQLRSTVREFYPAALEAFAELAHNDALAVLAVANTGPGPPALSLEDHRRTAPRQRRVAERAEEIQRALRTNALQAPSLVSEAMGSTARALVAVAAELSTQTAAIETELADRFEQHPDAKIIHSLAGLGTTLGARVLGEFGDDPNRYASAKCRKNYAGTSPITRSSGKSHVVLARYTRNRRLGDALFLWAFAALTASPGARAFYDLHRARGDTHNQALRALANRLVGILRLPHPRHPLRRTHRLGPPHRHRRLTSYGRGISIAQTIFAAEMRREVPVEGALFQRPLTVSTATATVRARSTPEVADEIGSGVDG